MFPNARPTRLLTGVLALIAVPAYAAPSTSGGRVSVAQVMEAIDEATSQPEAMQLLTAYLAGIGETAGILTAAADSTGVPYVTCARPIEIDASSIRVALQAAAPDSGNWVETPATPIIVASVIERAGCE